LIYRCHNASEEGFLSFKKIGLSVIQVVMLDGGRRPTKLGALDIDLLKALI
jgi:hypothetical protein